MYCSSIGGFGADQKSQFLAPNYRTLAFEMSHLYFWALIWSFPIDFFWKKGLNLHQMPKWRFEQEEQLRFLP